MNQFILIAPEIFLSVVAVGLLLGEAFFPAQRRVWVHLSFLAVAACLVHQVLFFVNGALPFAHAAGLEPNAARNGFLEFRGVFGMLTIDAMAIFFRITILAAVLLVLWLSADHFEFQDKPMGTFSAVLLLATVGMLLLVASTDLLMAVISLELLSIASFILTGFVFGRRSSGEGAIKFFLVGALSTAVFLFGVSYYYGYFGTTALAPLHAYGATGQRADVLVSLILVFLLAGLGFKLTMVPFHMWAPDAYEGAPTPATAFLSVAPKAATVGFLLRLLGDHQALGLTPVLAVLAALTMTVGNLGALHQSNLKRLLAYSSVSHVGYILVAVVAGGAAGTQAAMLYTAVYIFMNIGLFAGLAILSNGTRSEEIPAFAGLHRKSLGLALSMVVFLMSMTGLPPLAGFVGKYAVFGAVLHQPGLTWLAVVAALNSAVSLYYYFRIVHEMFFRDPADGAQPVFSPALLSCLAVSLALTVGIGLAPGHVLDWVRNVVGS